MRRARYKRFAKVDLQNQFVAVACNIKRWLQKLIKAASQTDPEADLSQQRPLTCPTAPFTSVLSYLLTRLPVFDFFSFDLA